MGKTGKPSSPGLLVTKLSICPPPPDELALLEDEVSCKLTWKEQDHGAVIFSICLLVFLAHWVPSVCASAFSFLNKLPLFLSMCVPGPVHCSGTQETGNFNRGSRDSDSQAITLGRKKKTLNLAGSISAFEIPSFPRSSEFPRKNVLDPAMTLV